MYPYSNYDGSMLGPAYPEAAPQVGNVWPLLLGLPLGALGGYFYRGWRDEHPGRWIPGLPMGTASAPAIPAPHVSGSWQDFVGPYVGGPWLDVQNLTVGGPWLDVENEGPYVGGPWLDVESMSGNGPYIGGPWVDVTGSQVGNPWVDYLGADMGQHAERRAWQQNRKLIESAKNEVIEAQSRNPAAAWVWSFDVSHPSSGRVMELFSTQVVPFSSVAQAESYMYDRLQMPHVALALFDTGAVRHWPNPIRWTKSDDPSYEPLIAQRIAEYSSTKTAGDYSGHPMIGSALSDVRERAQNIASKRAGSVVGVLHATKDQLWHALAFANENDADDWLETQDPESFTYAAFFNKNDATWPYAVIEKIGGVKAAPKRRSSIGRLYR